jgi:hypothetical protein
VIANGREVNRHARTLIDQFQKASRRLHAGAEERQAMGLGDDEARGEERDPTPKRVSKQSVGLGMMLVALAA